MSFEWDAFGQDISERNLELIRERERFSWFKQSLEHAVGRYSVEQLVKMLHRPPTWPGQREKVLVLLALTGEPAAVETLEAYEDEGEPRSFRLLLGLAIGEGRRRRRMSD